MWLKILLSGLIPVIVACVATWLLVNPQGFESEFNEVSKGLIAIKEEQAKLTPLIDRSTNALVVYGATKDKGALERYEKAVAEIPSVVASLGKVAVNTLDPGADGRLKEASGKLLSGFKNYKEACESAKPNIEKLSAATDEWVTASRNLDSMVVGMKTERTLRMFTIFVAGISASGVFAAVFGGVTWFLMIIFMGGSCYKRFLVVRRNINAMAERKPLEPLTKFGCGDEISKIDKLLHEAAVKIGNATS